MAVDENKLNEFIGKAVGDLGAAMSAALILVGDRLGLYRELAKGALTPDELARRTGTDERYVREWLGNQGAGGYVQFDQASGEWSLTEEQALCLADPNGPVDIPGAYNIVEATFHALGHTLDNFRSGAGMEWGEHHPCLFEGTERFFRAGYNTSLIGAWLPALDGVVDKLQSGAKVADVGCGHGASTILMATTYPDSEFVGYDYHAGSIDVAREKAAAAGAANARFEVADAVGYEGNGLRPHRILRLPARHGRSGRRVPACAPGDECRWHGDARRAVRERRGGRTTSIPSAGCCTGRPPRSAYPSRSRATVRHSALRPVRRDCAR